MMLDIDLRVTRRDTRDALSGAALLLGLATAGALLVNGVAWAASKIDDAIAAALRTRADIVAEITDAEARLARLRDELARIDAETETLTAAADQLNAEA